MHVSGRTLLIFKVVHHRCQAIAFMFNGGSCSSFTFYPIDTDDGIYSDHGYLETLEIPLGLP